MRKYKALEKLGEGSFASVHKCIRKEDTNKNKSDESQAENAKYLAVKCFKNKFYDWTEVKKLREVKSLTTLKHPNIIKCSEVILEKSNDLYLVFEYASSNLWDILIDKKRQDLNIHRIANLMLQLLNGLAYVHKHGYFHRDIKPENLLITHEIFYNHETNESMTKEVLKIADFGCTRQIRSRPPYTDYIATRWYRAPELLLNSKTYSSPIDIWACGVILGELFTRKNLFPGDSDIDMLHKIYSQLGSPTKETWYEGKCMELNSNLKIPDYSKQHLQSALKMDATGYELFQSLLTLDPKLRPSAHSCLSHSFFSTNCRPEDLKFIKKYLTTTSSASKGERRESKSSELETPRTVDEDILLTARSAVSDWTPSSNSNVRTELPRHDSDIDRMLESMEFGSPKSKSSYNGVETEASTGINLSEVKSSDHEHKEIDDLLDDLCVSADSPKGSVSKEKAPVSPQLSDTTEFDAFLTDIIDD